MERLNYKPKQKNNELLFCILLANSCWWSWFCVWGGVKYIYQKLGVVKAGRDRLFKQNDDMRWAAYGLRCKLKDLQKQIDDAKYYLKNPLELQKKYLDVFDYVKKWLNNRYGSKLKFLTEKEMFEFLYAERKKTHEGLKKLKLKRKLVKDKLSKMPKIKY